MSRWGAHGVLLAAGTLLLLAAPLRAVARPAPKGLLSLIDQEVDLERLDGRCERARVRRVHLCFLGIQRTDGSTAELPTADIRRVRRRGPGGQVGPWLVPDPPLLPCAARWARSLRLRAGARAATASNVRNPCKVSSLPSGFRVEWVGVRGVAGVGYAIDIFFGESSGWVDHFGAELVLFTLRWPRVYWEILRGGYGIQTGPYWGTSVGYAVSLDDRGRHELRVGIHATFLMGMLPTLSGVQMTYVLRTSRWLALEVGIMQFSFPFAVGVTFGARM